MAMDNTDDEDNVNSFSKCGSSRIWKGTSNFHQQIWKISSSKSTKFEKHQVRKTPSSKNTKFEKHQVRKTPSSKDIKLKNIKYQLTTLIYFDWSFIVHLQLTRKLNF